MSCNGFQPPFPTTNGMGGLTSLSSTNRAATRLLLSLPSDLSRACYVRVPSSCPGYRGGSGRRVPSRRCRALRLTSERASVTVELSGTRPTNRADGLNDARLRIPTDPAPCKAAPRLQMRGGGRWGGTADPPTTQLCCCHQIYCGLPLLVPRLAERKKCLSIATGKKELNSTARCG